MSSDFTEVINLGRDLGNIAPYLKRESRGALHRTSMKVKAGAIKSARAAFDSHAQYAAKSIDYDLFDEGTSIVSEVGYRNEGGRQVQGFLGAVLEYGGTRSAPYPVLGDALEANLDDLVTGQRAAAVVALREALRA